MKKTLITLAALATIAGNMAANQAGYNAAVMHLPTGDNNIIGYHYDLTGSTVYGTATPVTFTEKYISAWVGDVTATISRTDKHYTDDPAEKWTVYKFKVCRGIDGDDGWLKIEIGF